MRWLQQTKTRLKQKGWCIVLYAVILSIFFVTFYKGSDRFYYDKDYSSTKAGEVIDTLVLEPGSYQGTITYNSSTGAILNVFSGKSVNENNEAGKSYCYLPLPTATNQAELQFEVDQYDSDIGLYVEGEQTTITHLSLQSSNADFFQDKRILICLYGLALLGGFFLFSSKRRDSSVFTTKTLAVLMGFFFLVSIPVLSSSLHNAPFQDLVYHLNRIQGLSDSLGTTSFPIRIHPTEFGSYGQATSVFYPEMFLFIPAILRNLGMSLCNAYRVTELLVNAATIGIAYYSFKQIFSENKAALVGTALYTFSIYRLTALYVRSALGEAFAMMFLPLVAYGVYLCLFGNCKKWPILAFAMTGVLQSHLITTEMSVVICLLFAICYIPKLWWEKRLLPIVKAIGLCAILNLWWIVPFIDFSLYGVGALARDVGVQEPIVRNLASFFAITYPLQAGDQMPFSIGVPLALVFVACITTFLIPQLRKKTNCKIIGICVILSVLCFWMASAYFPWNTSLSIFKSVGGTLQFSWRLLSMATILLTIAGCLLFKQWKPQDKNSLLTIGIGICIIVFAVPILYGYSHEIPVYATKSYIADIDDDGYTLGGWYLPTDTPIYDLYYAPGIVQSDSQAIISEYQRTGSTLTYSYTSQCETRFDLPVIAYPGYSIQVNGQSVEPLVNDKKCLSFITTETQGKVQVVYTGKFIYNVGDIGSLLGLIGYFILRGKKKHEDTQNDAGASLY